MPRRSGLALLAFFVFSCSTTTTLMPFNKVESVSLAGSVLQNLTNFEILNIQEPSHVSHWFLACGSDCVFKETGQPLVEAWLKLRLSQKEVYYLHRGEFSATLAELGVELNHKITFSELTTMSLEEFLNYERKYFSFSNTGRPWNKREEMTGKEYGWLLKSFCHYLGPDGKINGEHTVPELIDFLITEGINRSGEFGTHELEGLATCAQIHKNKNVSELTGTFQNLQKFLGDELAKALKEMAASGQVYPDDETFGNCKDKEKNCLTMRLLSSQSHYLEWALLVPEFTKLKDNKIVLDRYQFLLEQAKNIPKAWVNERPGNANMYVSSVTHAIHVSKKLPDEF